MKDLVDFFPNVRFMVLVRKFNFRLITPINVVQKILGACLCTVWYSNCSVPHIWPCGLFSSRSSFFCNLKQLHNMPAEVICKIFLCCRFPIPIDFHGSCGRPFCQCTGSLFCFNNSSVLLLNCRSKTVFWPVIPWIFYMFL